MQVPVPSNWLGEGESPNLALLQAEWEENSEPEGRALLFAARDGARLAGRVFEPATPARAVAVLAPATGVPQRYYFGFARWLRERGYAVLCFDYRGMGMSPTPDGGVTMRDWVARDLSAALALARQRAGRGSQSLPLVWFGHSLGGNGLPMVEGLEHLDAAVTLGSQFGYWRLWDGWRAQVTRIFFQHWLPLWVRLSGRLPGWALGGGEALPGAAAMDWARWGLLPGYMRDDPACKADWAPQRFRGSLQVWSIHDDRLYGPRRAVDALADCFREGAARVERFHLFPNEVGLKRVGHFGIFRRSAAQQLWPLLLSRLEARLPALAS
ncbi:putative alpha/beta hydrolase [Inhella inkyongensis]|uniref:Putative alpha/beta hydrolase n=1 Tax=Inhella inkyongensis TaxID=392593 RepID=A0A840RZW5_9BURK|nr:alpha/beta fold hydrolase [Inhella inkyongensis]MBB5203545.1 putative alpha/beta hydrolase [Inhella inkyongensis]